MPELPDVRVLEEYLDATALHQEVAKVRVRDEAVLDGETPAGLGRKLGGRSFLGSHRHGKHLLVETDGAVWLTLHFGMTGELAYRRKADTHPEYARVEVRFRNGAALAFVCPRKLGRVGTTASVPAFLDRKDLGPDALRMDAAAFRKRLEKRRGFLKTALMDQSALAGIGNVYADEILFQAAFHPRDPVGPAVEGDAGRDLWLTLQGVLDTATEALAGRRSFPDTYLTPHREEGASCPRCGAELAREKVGGRVTCYCPRRQGEEAAQEAA